MPFKEIDPARLKQYFYFSQIGIGLLLLASILYFKRTRVSGFRSQERNQDRKASSPSEERRKQEGKTAQLLLSGISLDLPPEKILGVRSDADEQEIQRAYRERMKQYHPDRVGPPDSPPWKEAQRIAVAVQRARDELLERIGRKKKEKRQ